MQTPGPGRGTAPERDPDADAHVAASSAWNVTAYFLSGAAMFGFLGWLADRWLGTTFLVGAGVLAGMALSFYIIWIRYVGPASQGLTAPLSEVDSDSRPRTRTPEEMQ